MNKEKQLISQRMREISPEMDPLRLGTGWSVEDLSKPQIFIESTFGDSHPGSGHLDKLVAAAREGVSEEGGHGARYFTTVSPKKADMARDILQLICAMVKARAQTASTTHLPAVK